MKKFLLMLLVLMFTLGCHTCQSQVSPQAIVNSWDVIGTSSIGQTWVFQNHVCDPICDRTYIQVQAIPPSNYVPANCVDLHYTKTRGRAYWQPGAVNAVLDFPICPMPDVYSGWYSVASIMSADTNQFGTGSPWSLTADVQAITGQPRGYLIVPPGANATTYNTLITGYGACAQTGVKTWQSLVGPGGCPGFTSWRTDWYLENVDTEVYTGPALVSEQWENCVVWDESGEGYGCAHEKWYWAPNTIGLVRVDVLDIGNGPGQGFCTMDLGTNRCYTLPGISLYRVK